MAQVYHFETSGKIKYKAADQKSKTTVLSANGVLQQLELWHLFLRIIALLVNLLLQSK